jgi:NADPH2:quinone reductase
MGLFIGSHLPFILGTNIAGIVLTSTSPKYTPGQHIYGQGLPLAPVPNYSGLQEYALLPVSNSAPVPEGLSDEEAATLPINTATSFAALFHQNWLGFPTPWSQEAKTFDYSKEKLVIIGAGTNCGRLAIQFAKSVGIGLIVVTASLSNEKELLALGATHVVDRHLLEPELLAQVWAAVGGQEEIIKVLDCANWTFEVASSLVAKEKTSFIATLHQVRSGPELLVQKGKGKAEMKVLGVAVNNWGDEDTEFWSWLGKEVTEGRVRIPKFRVIEGLDVGRVNEALDSYRDGSPVVQAVVRPGGKA